MTFIFWRIGATCRYIMAEILMPVPFWVLSTGLLVIALAVGIYLQPIDNNGEAIPYPIYYEPICKNVPIFFQVNAGQHQRLMDEPKLLRAPQRMIKENFQDSGIRTVSYENGSPVIHLHLESADESALRILGFFSFLGLGDRDSGRTNTTTSLHSFHINRSNMKASIYFPGSHNEN